MKQDKRKLKILHITSAFEVGGQQKLISDIVHIDEFNEHYLAILRRSTEALAFFRKKIPVLFYKGLGDEEILSQLKNFIGEESIDIIMAHNRLAWDIAVEIYKSLPISIYYIAHSIDIKRQNETDSDRIDKLRSNLVFTDKIICTSEFLRNEYLKLMPGEKEKVIRIYNGVEAVDYNKVLSNKNIKDSLGIKKNQVLIGSIARLAKIKNQDFLIEAVQSLLKSGEQNFKLVIIGDGPEHEVLSSKTKKYNLQEFIILKENTFSVHDYYEAFDIFVSCSLFESCSLSILEAMLHALPVIASDVGGNREVVTDNESGFLFQLNDKEEFIEEIKKLINNPELGKQMGQKGLERVTTEFNIQVTVRNYQKLFNSHKELIEDNSLKTGKEL